MDGSNRPWYKIWWIYLAVIAAVVVVAVSVLAVGPADAPSVETPTPTATPSVEPTPAASLFLGVGVEDYETGVTSLDQGTIHEESMGAFTLVLLSVENSHDEPIAFDVEDVRGVDSSTRTLVPDAEATLIANLRNKAGLFLKAVEPGETVTGLVAFDVPIGETLLAVVVPDGTSEGMEIPIPY